MNYQYFGLFLSEDNRNKLIKVILDNPIIANIVFQKESTLYLDHCTLIHKSQHDEKITNKLSLYINDWFTLYIDKIGFSNKAIAFGVDFGNEYLTCVNSKPHITICTINGGKPVDSNNIQEWIPIPKIEVSSILKVIV